MAEHSLAHIEWRGELAFEAKAGSGHTVMLDSPPRPGHRGASPMELLLIGVAGCTAMDVVAILGKMREPIEALQVEVRGQRASSNPKYFTSLEITYRLKGARLSRPKVERAVELSHATYCSAAASLRPDCQITSRIEIADT